GKLHEADPLSSRDEPEAGGLSEAGLRNLPPRLAAVVGGEPIDQMRNLAHPQGRGRIEPFRRRGNKHPGRSIAAGDLDLLIVDELRPQEGAELRISLERGG